MQFEKAELALPELCPCDMLCSAAGRAHSAGKGCTSVRTQLEPNIVRNFDSLQSLAAYINFPLAITHLFMVRLIQCPANYSWSISASSAFSKCYPWEDFFLKLLKTELREWVHTALSPLADSQRYFPSFFTMIVKSPVLWGTECFLIRVLHLLIYLSFPVGIKNIQGCIRALK